MVAGRPRTVSLPPDEMIELGKEMVAYVKEHKPLHLNMWWMVEKEILENDWKCYIQHEEFLPYYKRALAIVGQQFIDKDSQADRAIKDRWQRVYFKDLRELEDFDKDRDMERKRKIVEPVTEEQNRRHDELMDAVSSLQKPKE